MRRRPSLRVALARPALCGIVLVRALSAAITTHAQDAPIAPKQPMQGNEMKESGEVGGRMQGHDMSTIVARTPAPDMTSSPPMEMDMESAFGGYPMTREGSGTSWQPDATPMEGVMSMGDDWMLMAHGLVNAIYDHQSGPRGADMAFTESMAMFMAQRPVGDGKLGLRAMVSLDPSMGKSGYPLLFETGETADGKTPLVDRQHPHDAFMELSASYSTSLSQDSAVYIYGGLPGEPALGPAAFMHRFSGMRIPEAPLTHHWLDSTHITFGVVTLDVSKGPFKLEASSFNGREPDPYRWNIETRKFDSWSTRLSYNPTPEWSVQASYGDLKSPEQLEPDVRVRRTTASASYQKGTALGPWQTTLAWGQNFRTGPNTSERLPGWLLESTLVAHAKHTFFGRLEQVRNGELFGTGHLLAGQKFTVRKLSVGYIHDFAKIGAVSWGLGGLVGLAEAPGQLDAYYGKHPTSTMVFLQGRL